MSEISNIYLVYCVRSKVPSNNLKKCPIPHHTVCHCLPVCHKCIERIDDAGAHGSALYDTTKCIIEFFLEHRKFVVNLRTNSAGTWQQCVFHI